MSLSSHSSRWNTPNTLFFFASLSMGQNDWLLSSSVLLWVFACVCVIRYPKDRSLRMSFKPLYFRVYLGQIGISNLLKVERLLFLLFQATSINCLLWFFSTWMCRRKSVFFGKMAENSYGKKRNSILFSSVVICCILWERWHKKLS